MEWRREVPKERKWSDVPGVLDMNCEVFFKSSGTDDPGSPDEPAYRSEERDVKEIRICGRLLPAKLASEIAAELEHIIDVDKLDDAHEAWLSSDARRDSAAKGTEQ